MVNINKNRNIANCNWLDNPLYINSFNFKTDSNQRKFIVDKENLAFYDIMIQNFRNCKEGEK